VDTIATNSHNSAPSGLHSALPILRWLPSYRAAWLRWDFVAGLTLAAYAIPVSMADASIAGLPSQVGLYCYMLGGAAYALFGTSRQASVGVTSAISIAVGTTMANMANGNPARALTLAATTALLVALLAGVAWALRLGQIVNFISETILSGFKVGAAIVIASTQLPKFFGLESSGEHFLERLVNVARHLGETHVPSLAVGLAGFALMLLGERLFPKRPVALAVMLLSILAMSFTGLGELGIKVVGQIPQRLPAFGLPDFSLRDFQDLLPLAMACLLLAYVENISVVRTFALKHGYAIDANQELLAVGAANLAAGLGQGYPVAGGMSQSAVNDAAGARTPLALLFASVGIGAVLVLLAGQLRNLPQSVLAAVVFMALRHLINLKELRHLRRVSRMEFRVAMVAVAGVLVLGILKGVLLAAVFSLILLLTRLARPHTALLGRFPGRDRFGEIARHPENEAIPGVLAYRVDGGLFYFSVEFVRAELLRLVHAQQTPPVKLVVFDLGSSPLIDLAAARMLASLHGELKREGITFKLAEVHGLARDILCAEGLEKRIGNIEQRMSVAALVDAFKPT
jgi:SulP family sulfate permease